MESFVVIFRQQANQLGDAEFARRAQETRPWAKAQNDAGHQLSAYLLGSEGYWCGPGGSSWTPPNENIGPVTALLFLRATALTQAVDIARSHPAVKYGASIEVRPWALPSPLPPQNLS